MLLSSIQLVALWLTFGTGSSVSVMPARSGTPPTDQPWVPFHLRPRVPPPSKKVDPLPQYQRMIPRESGAGRPMWTSEYERIFQVTRLPDEDAMPMSAKTDLEHNLTASQVIASIEEQDDARLTRYRMSAHQRNNPAALEPLDWRVQLDRPGTHGETVTIAQQCVYVGNKNFLGRRERTVEVLKHFMDQDPDLAWGRMRFHSGKVPDVTIILACTKARPDLVKALANHSTADFYLPSFAPPGDTPCPGLMLTDLISQTLAYNRGLAITRERDSEERLRERDQCAEELIKVHHRRHGLEQKILERVMREQLNIGGAALEGMCQNLITYTQPISQL